MKTKLITNFIILTTSTILVGLLDMATNAYITQKIGTTVLGSFSLIMNSFVFFITVSIAGIPLAITKLVSSYDENNDISNLQYSNKIAQILSFIISSTVALLVILFRKQLNILLFNGMVSEKIIIILAGSLPFICLNACFCGYFNALRKVNKPVIIDIFNHILKNSILIFLLKFKFSTFSSFALGIFISEFLSFILSYIAYKRDVTKLQTKISNVKLFTTLKTIFKIIIPISFTSYIRSGLSTLKHTLIPLRLQKFGYSYQYALSRYGMIHGIALPFILFPSLLINSFASLILPEYSRYFATKSYGKITNLTEKIFKNTIMISIYISFVIYLSSDVICMNLYKNSEVAFYVKILAPLITIMYLDFIVDSILKGLDLQVHVMKVNIIDLIISIGLIFFVVPIFGSFGYIIVIYASEFINGFMSINQLLKTTSINFKYKDWLIFPIISSIFSFLISKMLTTQFSINYFTMFLQIIIFSSFYLLILFLLKSGQKNKK